jgi:hypothetical protein
LKINEEDLKKIQNEAPQTDLIIDQLQVIIGGYKSIIASLSSIDPNDSLIQSTYDVKLFDEIDEMSKPDDHEKSKTNISTPVSVLSTPIVSESKKSEPSKPSLSPVPPDIQHRGLKFCIDCKAYIASKYSKEHSAGDHTRGLVKK